MVKCHFCGNMVEEGNFCGICSKSLAALPASPGPPTPEKSPPPTAAPSPGAEPEGVMSRIEKNVFFKIARGYAWLIAFIAAVGLAIAVMRVVPLMLATVASERSIAADEVRTMLELQKKGYRSEPATPESKMDPKVMAKLDQVIYELINLLPASLQKDPGTETLRREIRQGVAFLGELGDKIDALKDGKDIIEDFQEAERLDALMKYLEIKADRHQEAELKRAKALVDLLANISVLMLTIITITLVSMVLVLLAIERNTRRTSQFRDFRGDGR